MPRTLVKPLIEACHEAFPLRISPQLIEDRPKRDVLRFGPIGPCQDQKICPAVAFPALVELPTVTHWSIRQRQLNLEFVHPRLTCSLFQELRQCSIQPLQGAVGRAVLSSPSRRRGPAPGPSPVKRRVCPSQPPLTGALACVRERLDNGMYPTGWGQQKFLVVVPRAGIERPHQHVTSVFGGSTFPQLPYELLIFSVPAL